MTNELEKQFFITYGIKPKKVFKPIIEFPQFEEKRSKVYQEIKKQELEKYPQIKDKHILELLGLVNAFGFANPIKLKRASYEGIIEEILELVIDVKKYYENHRLQKIAWTYQEFKHQVRTLFEDEEQ